jgi:signal-transduction protein with cAMP-binding, CBS, and nucleotidyltransferase domain
MHPASFRDSINEEETEELLEALSASNLPVGKVINKKLISCTPETPLCEAAEIMHQEKCSSIVILQDNSVCGIWTEADVAKIDFTNPHEYLQPINNVMSTPVKTVPFSMRMRDVALSFRKEGIRHFLVVDEDDQPFGMVSQTDVVLTPGIEQFLRMQLVKSVIQVPPVILSEKMTLSKAVMHMHSRKANSIVVK